MLIYSPIYIKHNLKLKKTQKIFSIKYVRNPTSVDVFNDNNTKKVKGIGR